MATEVKYFANVPSGHGPNQYAWCRMSVHGHGGSASLTIANIDVIHGTSTRTHYRADGIVFSDGTVQTTAAVHGGGAHGAYNQSLNTTDAPTFSGLNLLTGNLNMHGGNISFYQAAHGILFSDGSSLTSADGLSGLPAPLGTGGNLLYSTHGHGWQQTHGWMQVGPTAAHGGGAHGAHSAIIMRSQDGTTATYYQSTGIRFADGTFQSTAASGSHGSHGGGSSPYTTGSILPSIVPVEGSQLSHGYYSTIAGGYSNTIGGGGTNGFIGSGASNYLNAAHSSIIGGMSNTIAHGVNNHIIGSYITVTHGVANTTFVNNFRVMDGEFIINNIPTTDPGLSGKVWNDSGTLKISSGI